MSKSGISRAPVQSERKFANNYILGDWSHVSTYVGIQLKLTHLQVTLLNLLIQNVIAGRLKHYDEDDPKDHLYYFNVCWWAKHLDLDKTTTRRALMSMGDTLTARDGTTVQLLTVQHKGNYMYVDLSMESIYFLVYDNIEFYNNQCHRHKRDDLCLKKKDAGESSTDSESEVDPDAALFFRTIKKRKEDMELMEALFPMGPPKKWSKQAESIIMSICKMARKMDVKLEYLNVSISIFAHLNKDGTFKKRREGVNKACKLVDDLYTGRFWRDHKNVFGPICKDVVAFKEGEKAKELVKGMQGDWLAIKKFLLNSAKHYMKAMERGMDTFQSIKKNYPTNIKDFLYYESFGSPGEGVANFLLYNEDIVDVTDRKIDMAYQRVKKNVDISGVLQMFEKYEQKIRPERRLSYWLQIVELSKSIKDICTRHKTSYQLADCYDFLFYQLEWIDREETLSHRTFELDSYHMVQAFKMFKGR